MSTPAPTPRSRHRTARSVVAACAGVAVASAMMSVSAPMESSAATGPDVRINEYASGGPGGTDDAFVEITNVGDADADIDGYRIVHCDRAGNRGQEPMVPDLEGVVLAPGETYMVAHADSTVADEADEIFTRALYAEASGIWLEDGDLDLVDRLSVSPQSRSSFCGTSIPSDLDYVSGQSWQRVDTTGAPHVDFIRTPRTPNEQNATTPDPGVQDSDVRVSEIANGGSEPDSDVVELANFGDVDADLTGWSVYACTEFGYRTQETLLATFEEGTALEPGAALVLGNSGVEVPEGTQLVSYDDALAELGSGVILADGEGSLRDAVGIYETDGVYDAPMQSTCTQGEALGNRLDFAADETYQRVADTGNNAADFVPAPRDLGQVGEHPDVAPGSAGREESAGGDVLITEVTHHGRLGDSDTFVELGNTGGAATDLDGWSIERCGVDGRRVAEPLVSDLGEVQLAPGQTLVMAQEGSALAADADLTYDADLERSGFGLMLRDSDGSLIDRVGVYFSGHASSSFAAESARYSHCIDGLSLQSELLEAEHGLTYQRYQATGSNQHDLVKAQASPGELPDLHDPADIPQEDLEPVSVDPSARVVSATPVEPAAEEELAVEVEHTTGAASDVTFHRGDQVPLRPAANWAFTGVSETAPPDERRLQGERREVIHEFPGDVQGLSTESTEGFPYQRYELRTTERLSSDTEFVWSGTSTGNNELHLYAWDYSSDEWALLDAVRGVDGGQITLVGRIDAETMVSGRSVDVLIQNAPATTTLFDEEGEPDQEFMAPDTYDTSLAFLGDTQSATMSYRDEFADMVAWQISNAEARNIDYSVQVGDLIQQWMWGTHRENRAREEYGYVSDLLANMEEASLPYGTLPGNHDNLWGRSNDLFNEYFPLSRFAEQSSVVSSFPEGESSNHAAEFTAQGAQFLVLHLSYLPVLGREEILQWADDVIADHPDHNVILAVHEFIDANGELTNRDDHRWTSQGQEINDALVVPNENVFLVLSGHVAAVGLNEIEDPAGIGSDRTVLHMLADYASFRVTPHYRDASFLRLLQIDIAGGRMAVNTYSPTLDDHNAWEYDNRSPQRYEDADDEFVVDVSLNDHYDKAVHTASAGLFEPFTEEGTAGTDADGIARLAVEPNGSDHGWFAHVTDGEGSQLRGPLWEEPAATE